jgi:hypothetical protein
MQPADRAENRVAVGRGAGHPRRRRRGKFRDRNAFLSELRAALDRILERPDGVIGRGSAAKEMGCDAETLAKYLAGNDGLWERIEWNEQVRLAQLRVAQRRPDR